MTKTQKNRIIAQCWTVLYCRSSRLTDKESLERSLNRLSTLLREADRDSFHAIFTAAMRGEDFPASAAIKYPNPAADREQGQAMLNALR